MIGNDLKEYPATHSMSTSWFFADEDGNIADFEFNENGPVPENAYETESSLESMLMDDFASKDGNGIWNFPLNKEQAEHLLSFMKPAEPSEIFSAIVQINLAKKDDLYASFSDRKREDEIVCFSEEYGLYAVDYFEEGQYEDLVRREIILKSTAWELWFNDICDEEGNVMWENENAEMFPFYIYQQQYDMKTLITRTVIPKNSYQLSQIPEPIRSKIIKLPLKFSECENLQIAEYLPFEKTMFMDDECTLGLSFHLLPTKSGQQYYFASSLFSEFCDWNYEEGFMPYSVSFTPTILYVGPAVRSFDFKRMMNGVTERFQHHYAAITSSITEVIPSPLIKLKEKGIPIPESISKYVSDKRGYLEQAFDYVNPHVVIIFEDALPQLRKWESETQEFTMSDKSILINGCEYPYILWNEMKANINEIRRLAALPYRGRKRCVLTEEEYAKWEKLNALCKQ